MARCGQYIEVDGEHLLLALLKAEEEAGNLSDEYVSAENLALAHVAEGRDTAVGDALYGAGITCHRFLQALYAMPEIYETDLVASAPGSTSSTG